MELALVAADLEVAGRATRIDDRVHVVEVDTLGLRVEAGVHRVHDELVRAAATREEGHAVDVEFGLLGDRGTGDQHSDERAERAERARMARATARSLLESPARHAITVPRNLDRNGPLTAVSAVLTGRRGGRSRSVGVPDECLDRLFGAEPVRRSEDQRVEDDADGVNDVGGNP